MKLIIFSLCLLFCVACGKPVPVAAPAPTPMPVDYIVAWDTEIFLDIDVTSSLLSIDPAALSSTEPFVLGVYASASGTHCIVDGSITGVEEWEKRIVISDTRFDPALSLPADPDCSRFRGTYAYAFMDDEPDMSADALSLILWRTE